MYPNLKDSILGTKILHVILILLFDIAKNLETCGSSLSKRKGGWDKVMTVAKKPSEDWIMKCFGECFGRGCCSSNFMYIAKEEIKVHM